PNRCSLSSRQRVCGLPKSPQILAAWRGATGIAVALHHTRRTAMRRSLVTVVVIGGLGFAVVRAMSARAADLEVVKAVAVQRGDLLAAVSAAGTLQPARVADIRYDSQDLVVRVLVKEGDVVRPGQIVAEMDTRLLTLARDQATQSARKDETSL